MCSFFLDTCTCIRSMTKMFGLPVTVCCCLKFYSCFKVEGIRVTINWLIPHRPPILSYMPMKI